MNATWIIGETQILQRDEVLSVISDLRRRAKRSVNTRQNLAIFHLAVCCGLRVSEICGLKLRDVCVGIKRPYIDIRRATTKGKKKGVGQRASARRIPLWWNTGTLTDLTAWKSERTNQGAGQGDFFVCCQSKEAFGNQLDRFNVRARFVSACRVLGKGRQAKLTIHHGRHTFISHALAGGRSLARVKEAAGHSNISTTSIYTHVVDDDDEGIGDIFGE